jgi:hypothetical protein
MPAFPDHVRNLTNTVSVAYVVIFLARAATAGVKCGFAMFRRLARALAQNLEEVLDTKAKDAPASRADSPSDSPLKSSRATMNTTIMRRFFTATTGSFVKDNAQPEIDKGAGFAP